MAFLASQKYQPLQLTMRGLLGSPPVDRQSDQSWRFRCWKPRYNGRTLQPQDMYAAYLELHNNFRNFISSTAEVEAPNKPLITFFLDPALSGRGSTCQQQASFLRGKQVVHETPLIPDRSRLQYSVPEEEIKNGGIVKRGSPVIILCAACS